MFCCCCFAVVAAAAVVVDVVAVAIVVFILSTAVCSQFGIICSILATLSRCTTSTTHHHAGGHGDRAPAVRVGHYIPVPDGEKRDGYQPHAVKKILMFHIMKAEKERKQPG